MKNLENLYIEQLQDLWSANQQARQVIKEMAEIATDDKLREKLEKGIDRIKEHNSRLEEIIKGCGAKANEEHCKGMEGLVKEARKHALEEEYEDDALRDAQIIAQYQRLTHYGIAVYGTCRALAEELGNDDDAAVLAGDLENVKKGDAVMNDIAENGVNQRAA